MPDAGLPAPDVVLFLDLTIEQAMERGQFGEERYEKEDFQRQVRAKFDELMNESTVQWQVINAARTIEEVEEDVRRHATAAVAAAVAGAQLKYLW